MSEEILHRGKFLELKKCGRWEYVSRVNARGAAHIVAVTRENEWLLVEQFRVPVNARTLELPAGIIGDEAAHRGESIEDSAMRELLEETGYQGASARILHSGPTAPGLTSEQLYFVEVTDLKRIHSGGGVDGEDITVHRVGASSLVGWLRRKAAEGLMIDQRIYAAMALIKT
ncbi:MAG: NUDIX hydrolase [Pseudomonadota bacterium]